MNAMNCWSVLGLEAGADERSVKRAYARLLKVHRPDEDAAAFQRLREAYDRALEFARLPEQDDEEQAWHTCSEPAGEPDMARVEPAAFASPLADPVEPLQPAAAEPLPAPAAVQPPDISLQQMYTWLEEGRDRDVLEAIGTWLASEWLMPFDRRADFEQQVLAMLEQAQWSPAFFDALSQLMGWDDDLGHLPCEGWRWARLIERCQEQAWLEALERTLASDSLRETHHGRAARFLLAPLSELDRRRAADSFSAKDWQKCMELAGALEYQYPDACERLGVTYISHWRRWLPRPRDNGLYAGFWLILSLLLGTHSVVEYQGSSYGWANAAICAVVSVPLMLWFGTAVYHIWARTARPVLLVEMPLSRLLVPARFYRQGSGLLVLRHLLPLAVGSVLISAPFKHVPWPKEASAVGLFALGSVLLWLSFERRLSLPESWLKRLGQVHWRQVRRTGLLVLAIGATAALLHWLNTAS